MAYNPNRTSTFSMTSATTRPGNLSVPQQVSTQTLLNSLHTCYTSGEPLSLESSTSLVVNTWVSAGQVGPDGRIGGTVDLNIGRKAFEHARRRAEDGCVVLASLHDSTPSLFAPFISSLPFGILPSAFWTSLDVIRAFTHCVTPANHSTPKYSSLAATFTLNLAGTLTGATLALSTSGLDTQSGLLNIPSEPGHRAFDIFYQLRSSSASKNEKEFLDLQPSSAYSLLKRSGTFLPPGYIPTLDDEASGDDLRQNLKIIGIKGSTRSNLIAALTGLLKLGESLGYLVDEEVLEETCDAVSPLLDIPVEVLKGRLDTLERETFIAGIYEALVDWVIARANEAIAQELKSAGSNGGSGMATPPSNVEDDNSVSITVVELPRQNLGKAVALRTVFDDSQGINLEMKQDGVPVTPGGSSIIRDMKEAVAENEVDLGIMDGAAGREAEADRDRREAVLEKVSFELRDDVWLKDVLHPVHGAGIMVGKTGRFDLASTLASSRVWFQLAIHPTDDAPASLTSSPHPWAAGTVSRQLRAWRLPEWANRRNKSLDYTADFDIDEFVTRYSRLGCREGKDGVESWIVERGWSNGEVIVGHEHVWIREGPWWELEGMIDMRPETETPGSMMGGMMSTGGFETAYSEQHAGSGFFGNQFNDAATIAGSRDNLVRQQSAAGRSNFARSIAPTAAPTMRTAGGGDYGLGRKGDDRKGDITYYGDDPELAENKVVTEQPISRSRKVWVAVVWALTFWIPSPALRFAGRMKRPDVRMAWREKFVLMLIIFLMNGIVIFWIIAFGKLICPQYEKAWNQKEVGYHQGDNDYWVSHMGKVYDLSKFWKTQHSDSNIKTTKDNMQPFAGTDMTQLIRPPLARACRFLVTDEALQLQLNNTDILLNGQTAQHLSGPKLQPDPTSKLSSIDWYAQTFLPRMKEMVKGDLVIEKKRIKKEGNNGVHKWVIMNEKIYDLTDYFYTKDQRQLDSWFIPSDAEKLIQDNVGEDITQLWKDSLNSTTAGKTMNCLDNMFYSGLTDFRETPRCQANKYILLAFTVILCTVIGVKFLAALQLGSKRRPSPQDKFVICQVPAYTEGEDQLRKGLDSLTALAYDNKRKLICVICDGMIVGGGNDRPTPKIVLDILGVDPKIDPPALPFRSVGNGSEQLNYGKVYSGLYEYEGNVVPYIVVVKVGKESEQHKAKPGNRGKRDSQILLMSFLNRVHHRSSMSPLELEMFHQINNVIGVDPEMYEYLLMVDADTMVREDSLNRLVATCANDAKIAGICGETSLENEERSWWTMIQVYEYYISHHLAKAFESLFGSVTCLPGCFCMYRLRTSDKGKPLIISDKVIGEYSDCNVDTLHKKNLLSLGEDRYLTTLMTKHFPQMSYKFVPDAYAQTAAPEKWSVLLSQRRRWINSTIHNLAELVMLRDLCGFCCFSMRFVVFIDLFGTVILPATCVYLGYLIYRVATHSGQFPLVSIIMLAAVYGLQAVIFIIKRQWQHIGWMIIYIIAFPIYAFVLPMYSFWKQDDFSWGNTRIVIGEKGNKQLIAVDDEGFDPRSIPLQRWDDYAAANNLPGRRGYSLEKQRAPGSYHDDAAYEMDDMQSMYSSAKPASTILTGFPAQGHVIPPPNMPGTPFQGMQQRQSTYSSFGRYHDQPSPVHDQFTPGSQLQDPFHTAASTPYTQHRPSMTHLSSENLVAYNGSSSNLLGSTGNMPRARSPLGGPSSRPISSVTNFQTMMNGPSDEQIVQAIRECLRGVELDHLTKKQLMALVEQRLQTGLQGERKEFLGHMIDVELANL